MVAILISIAYLGLGTMGNLVVVPLTDVSYVDYRLTNANGRTVNVIQTATSNTRVCAVLCSSHEGKCSGFKMKYSECTMYELVSNTGRIETEQLYMKTRVLKTQMKMRKAFYGNKCRSNRNCKYRYGQCKKMTSSSHSTKSCTCRLGYSFDFQRNECVERCSEYGTDYTEYNAGIAGYNVEQFKAQSGEECVRRCINTTRFVCINCEFSYDDMLCQLSATTWMDVEPDNRQKRMIKLNFYYRHCKK